MTNEESGHIDLHFDSNVFSLETIKRALYRYADICSFDIGLTDQQIKVTLHVTTPANPVNTEDLCARIRNEVLDQDLRDTISRDTANIRTLILANAFSNTGLVES